MCVYVCMSESSVRLEETTYVSSTNQPTNQPSYLALRITIPHESFYVLQNRVLHDLTDYCLYPHKGSKTEKEHYHVAISGTSIKPEALRKRCKDAFKQSGNGFLSVKVMLNDLKEFITYAAKEKTIPVFKGDQWPQLIQDAPEWHDYRSNYPTVKEAFGKPRLAEFHTREITYRCLIKRCLAYRQRAGIRSEALEDTLSVMLRDGYSFNIAIRRGGLPSSFFDEFRSNCQDANHWTKHNILRMRVDENWTRPKY